MTSIPVTDVHGNIFNLKVQPAFDNPGEFVLVAHATDEISQDLSSISVLSYPAAGDKFYRHAIDYYAEKMHSPLRRGQVLRLRVTKSADDSGDYVLLARSDR